MRCAQGHYVGDIDPSDPCPTCEAEGGSPDPWELVVGLLVDEEGAA